MHVAIKQAVLDKILERIHQIKRDNREPEYIVVSHDEYAELHRDLRAFNYIRNDYYASLRDPSGAERVRLGELTVETREFKLRDSHRGRASAHPYIRTFSREKFMNIPLYVVPSEYMPA